MYQNRVNLSDEQKKQVVEVMQSKLAASFDMYSQAKFAHWNVKGDNFYQLHLLFDKVAKVIFKQVDPIAERMTQLGGVANGTARQAAMGSNIPEYPVDTVAGMDHVRALADALGCYCADLREASEQIEKSATIPPRTSSSSSTWKPKRLSTSGVAPRSRGRAVTPTEAQPGT